MDARSSSPTIEYCWRILLTEFFNTIEQIGPFAGMRPDVSFAPITAIYATRRGLAGSTHSRSSCVADPRYELDDYLRRPEEQRRQARPPIDVGILRWSKPDLEKLFDGYCACCEAPFQDYGFGQINHYRPKGGGGGHMRSKRLGVRI